MTRTFKLLLILLLSVSGLTESYAYTGREIDSMALREFYDHTGGASWTNNTNWTTGTIDTWYGVTFDAGMQRVTRVEMDNNNINGTLTAGLANLDSLRIFLLTHNSLSGHLDASHWSALRGFTLAVNVGSWTISLNSTPYYYRYLDTFNGVTSGLYGSVDISGMPVLSWIDISSREYVNTITNIVTHTATPDYYTELWNFAASGIYFSGTLNISNMPKLQDFSLGGNQADWTLITNPAYSYYNYISSFSIRGSQYQGTVDLRGARTLATLSAGNNPDLTDIITDKSANYYSNLSFYHMEGAAITSPMDLRNMPALWYIYLAGSEYPSLQLNPAPDYYNALEYLFAFESELTGVLDISNMPALVSMQASNNHITGIITNTGADYYPSLFYIVLAETKLGGTLDLSNMPALGYCFAFYLDNATRPLHVVTNPTPSYYTDPAINLTLTNANLHGTLDFRGMPGLRTGLAYGNHLTQVLFAPSPATYYTSAYDFGTDNNALTFEDIEPFVGIPSNVYTYSPQDSVATSYTYTKAEGSSFTFGLSPVIGGTANIYNWYHNGVYYSTGINVNIASLSASDAGVWRCEITNSIATGLTLHARPVYLKVVPVPSFTTTPATCMPRYNSTTGIWYSDGSVTVTSPTGGGYTYSTDQVYWQSGTTFDSLTSGSHTIWVKNASGQIFSGIATVGYEGPVISVSCVGSASCDGSASAQIKFTVSRIYPAGSCTYDYEILPSGSTTPVLTATGTLGSLVTATIPSALPGIYILKLKSNGCNTCEEQLQSFLLTAPNLSVSLSNVNNTNTIGNVFYTCGLSGTLPIKVKNSATLGGCLTSTTYTDSLFTWTGSAYTYTSRYQGSNDTTTLNLNPGKYYIKAWLEDLHCSAPPLYFEIQQTTLDVMTLKKNPDCHDGTGRAEAIVSSGLRPISYYWLDGSDTVSVFSSVNPLDPGFYDLHVIDGRGCLRTDTLTIVNPPALNTPELHPDACMATADITDLAPPHGPYTFTWHYKKVTRRTIIDTVAYNANPADPFVYVTVTDTSDQVVFSQYVSTHTSGLYTSNPHAVDTNFYFNTGIYYVEVTDKWGCKVTSAEDSIVQPDNDFTYTIGFRWKGITKPDTTSFPPPPPPWEYDPIVNTIEEQTVRCITSQTEQIQADFTAFCFNPDSIQDVLVSSYELNYQHYTLYYYDRAGRLTQTVSPEGVNRLLVKPTSRQDTVAYTLNSTYGYNSLGQLTTQNSSDGGASAFIYDNVGRLRFSQNARQKADSTFSYTKYDLLGRITEVGESQLGDTLFSALDTTLYTNNVSFPSSYNHQQTFTYYSTKAAWVSYMGTKPQRYTLNRVSYIAAINLNGDTTFTYYSYDPHGNVEWLMQHTPGMSDSWVGYEYDLISNKVLKVKYNEYLNDKFFHRYSYDEDNRLTKAETSSDGYVWEADAAYDYYAHGPLRRTVLGQDHIQGIDYTYTIQGWIKGINSPNLKTWEDPGADGTSISSEATAKDEFGMTLTYFEGDFKHSGSSFNSVTSNKYFLNPGNQNLYNGNISSWTFMNNKSDDSLSGNVYRYDRLNRIKKADFYTFNGTGYSSTSNYDETFSYDANGNILTATRNATSQMDDLEYEYYAHTNRLKKVTDAASPSAYTTDIDDQDFVSTYVYDEIGNLIADSSENIRITWNVYGKVNSVEPLEYKPGTHHGSIRFTYDAMGHRIAKEVNDSTFTTAGVPYYNPEYVTTTHYTRDAQGNVMSVYKRINTEISGDTLYKAEFIQKEVHLYGSDRLGMETRDTIISTVYFTINTLFPPSVSAPLSPASAGNEFHGLRYIFPDHLYRDTERDTTIASFAVSTTVEDSTGANRKIASVVWKKAANTSSLLQTASIAGADTAYVGLRHSASLIALDSNGVVQFTGIGGNYWGVDNTFLILDADGNSIPGSTAQTVDTKAQALCFAIPQSVSEYAVITRTQDGRLNYLTIDMSLSGNGTITGGNKGAVSASTLINAPGGAIWGRTMAAMEDRIKDSVYVYATAWKNDTTRFYKISFGTSGNYTMLPLTILSPSSAGEPLTLIGKDSLGQGQMKISSDGKALVQYQLNKRQGFFATCEAELVTYSLDYAGNISAPSITATSNVVQTVSYGTLPNSGLEVTADNKYIVYNQQALVVLSPASAGDNRILARPRGAGSQGAPLLLDTIGTKDVQRTSDLKSLTAWSQQGRYFVIDANGNVTRTTYTINGDTSYVNRYPLQNHVILPYDEVTEGVVARYVGDKDYELKDHLGNVRVVVTDAKGSQVVSGSVVGLLADVSSYSDYYAFGMTMPGRNYSSDSYRYGFNGKENDKEGLGGGGNTYDYGFRIYNPGLGRFLSVDPLTEGFPWWSPYHFAGNSPVAMVDLDGLETHYAPDGSVIAVGPVTEAQLELVTNEWVKNKAKSTNARQDVPQIIAMQEYWGGNAFLNVAKPDVDLTNDVPFVSQYSLERPEVACCRANQKILSDFGLENSGTKSGRIITAEESDDKTELNILPSARTGVDYIDEQLNKKNPVMVGVNHTLGKGQSDGTASDHYVMLVKRKYDEEKGQYYYNFYEVGTQHEDKGKSDKNRLYLNSDNSLTGTNYAGKRSFTVTEVRKNGKKK